MSVDDTSYLPAANIVRPERFAEGSRSPGALYGAGGGGTTDGMDPWQQTVETRLSELRGEIREVRHIIYGAAAFILVALGSGFLYLAGKVENSNLMLATKIDGVYQKLADVNERTARIEGMLVESEKQQTPRR